MPKNALDPLEIEGIRSKISLKRYRYIINSHLKA